MNDTATLELVLHGEDGQRAFGAHLAQACGDDPLLIFLAGELGAGKTTLTRGFLHGLGHRGAVKSPTYTLVEPYDIAGRRVYHLDLYRVANPGELEYLGLREMLVEDAVLLIEWPERGAGWLPPPDLEIRLFHQREGRRLELSAPGVRGQAVLARLRELL
jgi:tRNA threonylcarbamoyladenosine biosynthesis protein TsaE